MSQKNKLTAEKMRTFKLIIGTMGVVFMSVGALGYVFLEQTQALLGLDAMGAQIICGALVMIAIVDFVLINVVLSNKEPL